MIYLEPWKIVEMSVKEELKFIKLMKEHNIRDLTIFFGYETE